jgi:hypothetical protein
MMSAMLLYITQLWKFKWSYLFVGRFFGVEFKSDGLEFSETHGGGKEERRH